MFFILFSTDYAVFLSSSNRLHFTRAHSIYIYCCLFVDSLVSSTSFFPCLHLILNPFSFNSFLFNKYFNFLLYPYFSTFYMHESASFPLISSVVVSVSSFSHKIRLHILLQFQFTHFSQNTHATFIAKIFALYCQLLIKYTSGVYINCLL